MQSLPEIIGSIEKKTGDICLSEEFFDRMFCVLNPYEQITYLHLLRFRDNETDSTLPISLSDLVDRTHLSKSSIQRAIVSLENRGFLRRVEMVLGKNKKQGNRYWVLNQSSNMKSSQNRLPYVNTPTIAETTKVNVKELVSGSREYNVENCPDCHGTGFFYKKVDGVSGVVRCKHENYKG